jgi:hypothetical protein
MFDPPNSVLPIFNADTPPNMLGGGSERKLSVKQFLHPGRSFRQDLIGMRVSLHHHSHDLDDVVIRHKILKKIAH